MAISYPEPKQNFLKGMRLPQEFRNEELKNNLMNAQTYRTNMLADLAPEQLAYKNNALSHQKERFGNAFQQARMLSLMSQTERTQWITQNQEAYANILTDLGNAADPANDVNNGTPKNINSLNTTPSMPSPPPIPMGRYKPLTKEQIDTLKRVGETQVNHDLSSAAGQRQYEGAQQVEFTMNDPRIQRQVLNASQYAGIAKRGKKYADAWSTKNPEAYQDYLAFKHDATSLIGNRIRSLDKMGATLEETKKLDNMFHATMDSLDSNPERFIIQWNKLGETLDIIAASVEQSVTPINKNKRLEGFKPIKIPGAKSDNEVPKTKSNSAVKLVNPVNVISADGVHGQIEASELQEALKEGYKRR